MHRILKVAQREYIEMAKTRMFILMVLFAPILVGLIIYFTKRATESVGPRPPIKVAVNETDEELGNKIKNSFDNYNTSNPKRQILFEESGQSNVEQEWKDKLRSGQLDAYVMLNEGVLGEEGRMRIYTQKPKPSIIDALWTIEHLFRDAIIQQRYELKALDQEMLGKLNKVPIERIEIGAAGQEKVQSEAERVTRMIVPFFFMYLMFLGIFVMGQHILTSVIEEKSSRVIEVLLSAASPFELMSGKIMGLAGIGVTVISLWGGAAYMAARWQGFDIEVTCQLMVYFPVYYILGFLLFSSIMAGVGSVCNTTKEAQSLMMPLTLIFILPLIAWFKLVQSPDGILARVLSFVPPLTPMVMVLRLSADSGLWVVEIACSIIILFAAVLVMMWIAAKIFRTGILMYGKKPGLREIIRWLKQS